MFLKLESKIFTAETLEELAAKVNKCKGTLFKAEINDGEFKLIQLTEPRIVTVLTEISE